MHFLYEVYLQIEREKIMNFVIKSTRFFIIDLLILIIIQAERNSLFLPTVNRRPYLEKTKMV